MVSHWSATHFINIYPFWDLTLDFAHNVVYFSKTWHRIKRSTRTYKEKNQGKVLEVPEHFEVTCESLNCNTTLNKHPFRCLIHSFARWWSRQLIKNIFFKLQYNSEYRYIFANGQNFSPSLNANHQNGCSDFFRFMKSLFFSNALPLNHFSDFSHFAEFFITSTCS